MTAAQLLPSASDATHLAKSSASCVDCRVLEASRCAIMAHDDSASLDRDLLALSSPIRSIRARKTISHPKDWSDHVVILCGGWAVVSVALPGGGQQIVSILLPGDIASVACLFGPTQGRSIHAVTDVTYRHFDRAGLLTNLFKTPLRLKRLSQLWLEERRQADQLALDLGRRSADERIARLILFLRKRLSERGKNDGQTIEFPLRQRHIADATGLTSVHVSKVISQFQRAGLIEIDGRSLTILDDAELQRVADG